MDDPIQMDYEKGYPHGFDGDFIQRIGFVGNNQYAIFQLSSFPNYPIVIPIIYQFQVSIFQSSNWL